MIDKTGSIFCSFQELMISYCKDFLLWVCDVVTQLVTEQQVVKFSHFERKYFAAAVQLNLG